MNAEIAGYPMGFGTAGGNGDQVTNDCGIA
jgi:hypothetical protein